MEIFIAYRNADMTEGRGPMVIDTAFINKTLADQYIDEQFGVMGRKAKWSREKYGDWEVKPIQVLDMLPKEKKMIEDQIRQVALSKLTDIEKKVLGLWIN